MFELTDQTFTLVQLLLPANGRRCKPWGLGARVLPLERQSSAVQKNFRQLINPRTTDAGTKFNQIQVVTRERSADWPSAASCGSRRL